MPGSAEKVGGSRKVMPGYRPIVTQYMHSANVLIRLTPDDSKALANRLNDALGRGTGVNLIFTGMANAFSLTQSDERGEQIKCIAFNKNGYRVDGQMKGYNGPWSHVEIVMPLASIGNMKTFLDKVQTRQPELVGMPK